MNDRMTLGATGAVIAVLAILVGVLHFFLGPIDGPRSLEETAYETAKSLREAIVAGVRGEDYEPPAAARPDRDQVLVMAVTAAGALAILLGIGALLRREAVAPGAAAMSLGVTAVVLEVSIVVAGIILAVLLLAAVLSMLGLELPG